MSTTTPATPYVCIHGATLASLMQAAATSGDCEGLLFGKLRRKTSQHFQDHDHELEVVSLESEEVCITSYTCSSSGCFANALGQIQGEKLEALTPGGRDPLVGWFSFRPATPLVCTMREAAVSHSLRMHLEASASSAGAGKGLPLLFLILSTATDHSTATLSFSYKLLVKSSPGSLQSPVELEVISLAGGLGHKSYDEFRPYMNIDDIQPQMHRLKVTAGSSDDATIEGGDSGGAGKPQLSLKLSACADAAATQVGVMEEYYTSVLQHYASLCRQVSDSAATVDRLEEEKKQMESEIDALEAKPPHLTS